MEKEKPPMKVAEILKAKNRPVVTAKPDTEISAVMQLMKLENIGCVVLSENGEHADGKHGYSARRIIAFMTSISWKVISRKRVLNRSKSKNTKSTGLGA